MKNKVTLNSKIIGLNILEPWLMDIESEDYPVTYDWQFIVDNLIEKVIPEQFAQANHLEHIFDGEHNHWKNFGVLYINQYGRGLLNEYGLGWEDYKKALKKFYKITEYEK